MKRLYNAFLIAFFTVLLVAAALRVDWQEVFRIASRADAELVVLAVLITLLRFLIWSFKWQLLISSIKVKVPFFRVLLILMAGLFVSTSTPGANIGGEPLRAYYLAKEAGIKKSAAMATVIMDKSGNYFAFFTYSLMAFILLMEYFEARAVKLVFFVVLLIAFGGASYMVLRRNHAPLVRALRFIYTLPFFEFLEKRFGSFDEFESFVYSRIKIFKDTLKHLWKNPVNLAANLLLSYALWLTSFIKTYLIFLALGIKADFLIVSAIKAISVLLGMMSFIPGGFGVIEGVMVALFSSYGFDTKTALAGVLLSRTIYYVFSLGLGYLCLLWLRIEHRGSRLNP